MKTVIVYEVAYQTVDSSGKIRTTVATVGCGLDERAARFASFAEAQRAEFELRHAWSEQNDESFVGMIETLHVRVRGHRCGDSEFAGYEVMTTWAGYGHPGCPQ